MGRNFFNLRITFNKKKYVVIVLKDSEDLFVNFNFEIDNNELPDIAIKYFEDECINRFTCYGDFSFEEVKENSGEEILFH